MIAVLAFLFVFACYLAKLAARPAVLLDDLKIAPARGAVTAGSMCWMLVAAILVPHTPEIARVIWWGALVLHTLYLICVVRSLVELENPMAVVTPILLLPFVGYIVAAVSGGALGYEALSRGLILGSIPIVMLILLLSLINAGRDRIALPDRISFVIALAPVSIYAIAAKSIMDPAALLIFVYVSLVVFAGLLLASKWMLTGGWKPSWAALTFPLAAFAGAMIQAEAEGLIPSPIQWVALALASFVIPFVLYRTCQMWVRGKLAEATKSAVA